jgi:hypothetical protein
MTALTKCNKPMPAAKNGKSRGTCTRNRGHNGYHANSTCPDCGIPLTQKNAKPSVVRVGNGKCNNCNRLWQRFNYGYNPLNTQTPESEHVFPCGCSGTLPQQKCSNKFAVSVRDKFWCRISRTLVGLYHKAKDRGHSPVPLDTPHDIIRENDGRA